jgi:hypothetical protein
LTLLSVDSGLWFLWTIHPPVADSKYHSAAIPVR